MAPDAVISRKRVYTFYINDLADERLNALKVHVQASSRSAVVNDLIMKAYDEIDQHYVEAKKKNSKVRKGPTTAHGGRR